MNILLLALGALMLYGGAEWLVAGASRLALSLRVPQLIVGLTVVAYGTSAPEVIVGIQAARGGHGDVALGNILGSNIANLGLILGVSTLVRPPRLDGVLRRRELPVLLAATLSLPLVLLDGVVRWWEASLLVGGAVVYTVGMVWSSSSSSSASASASSSPQIISAMAGAATAARATQVAAAAPAPTSRTKQSLTAVSGLAVLLVGGHVFVDAATKLALSWGMSERLVGLTIVAVGTSLPELATGVIAAARGSSDIAVGNVVGSNIFNILLCLGMAASVGSIDVSFNAYAVDLGVLVAMTLLTVFFLRSARTLRRSEGALLVAAYGTFLGALAVR